VADQIEESVHKAGFLEVGAIAWCAVNGDPVVVDPSLPVESAGVGQRRPYKEAVEKEPDSPMR